MTPVYMQPIQGWQLHQGVPLPPSESHVVGTKAETAWADEGVHVPQVVETSDAGGEPSTVEDLLGLSPKEALEGILVGRDVCQANDAFKLETSTSTDGCRGSSEVTCIRGPVATDYAAWRRFEDGLSSDDEEESEACSSAFTSGAECDGPIRDGTCGLCGGAAAEGLCDSCICDIQMDVAAWDAG